MVLNKSNIVWCFLVLCFTFCNAQTLSLDEVLNTIKTNNPQLKMYDADIQSMDAAADGAKSWMPPQIETGFFMTPYNSQMWKASDMSLGMGQYMIGATQMIPNFKKQNAESKYMSTMSSVEAENKNYTINQLNAQAKTNYYQWIVLKRKIKVASENTTLLSYMIKSMEIRYQYNMDKLPSYYKAKSQYEALQSEIVMLQNNIAQKRISLNLLMAKDKNDVFEIDNEFQLKDFDNATILDTVTISKNRSDIKGVDKTIALNNLKIETEKAKLRPEFGIKYDHMFTFGNQPDMFSVMGMVTLPLGYSTKMNKANIESFKLKNESLNWQKQMMLNEATGMISAMSTELSNLKKQYQIADKNIIPALRKNYDTAVLAWQNNTGDLFVALEAFEALNMAQMDALDKLSAILSAQVELEKQLEIK